MNITEMITWFSTCVYQVLRSPLHLKKAKPLIDGSSELLNTKENDANANNKETNIQERKPALARKRAQFSLKPDTSQPSTTLEPSFQFDQLQNPEKFESTKSTEDAITTSQITEVGPENQPELQPTPSINKKGRRSPGPKKKRQSLADAGSSWTSGVRRSQRVRSRPLEYWKGERFLYGRVHSSMPTVIGLKYIPAAGINNGKSDFKVVSFVSNEHKELLDFAALH